MSVVMSRGIIMAVPDAWITRAVTSNSKPGDRNATRVPSENRLIAVMNT